MGDVFWYYREQFRPFGPERHTGRSLRFRWRVDSFIRTDSICYVAWRWIIAATLRGTIHPHRLYAERGGRQIAAPTDTPVDGTIQPHGVESQRPRNGT